ncbi:cyclase protein [Rutstroemia sp. NJR-2017a BBW]|nr:cyclase protein [Rutstroemia sp. NJR-2017a BBW]
MSDIQSKAYGRLTKVADFITGNKTATTIPFDPNSTKFPLRKDVPLREDAPEGASAWVWGNDDYIGRLNLLTPGRVTVASNEIQSGEIVPLNLPLHVPNTPAFGREPFEHTIKELAPDMAFDDKYTLNTQSGTQWDGFRHMAHMPSATFYNGTKGKDIIGEQKDPNKCGIHHWAEHGIAGRGILIDYWSYANENGIVYDPFDYHTISYSELEAAGKSQGIDIRPASKGGDIQIGDLLFVRSGFVSTYYSKSPEARAAAALRPHSFGPDDGQRWAGVKQEEAMLDWLHDCYFSAVAGDAPAFEAWPSKEHYYLHEYILALWGMPLGEMFDLEKLAKTCKEKGRWTFFVTSAPNNCVGGVSSHANALAIF